MIDSHVHLHFPEYDQDRERIIAQAQAAGIQGFVNVGTDLPTSYASAELAQKSDFIWATVGIHPHDSKDATRDNLKAIEALLQQPRVVAIGEVGLDYFRDHSPAETQREIFLRFLEMHKRTKKPLVIHCRDAYDDLHTMIRENLKPPVSGVMHCFSSDAVTMKRFLDMGFYISFAGPLTYKKNDVLREACRQCPDDRLLLETDAPFLPPQSMRGKRNEPGFMVETATVAAQQKQMSLEAVSEITARNTRRLFGL